MRHMKRAHVAATLLTICLLTCGCVHTGAELLPNSTLAPTPSPTPEPTPEPTPQPTMEVIASQEASQYDATGAYISGPDHFRRYLSFENIQVYEQCEDTFMDAVVTNSYSETIVCALSIVFYDDDGNAVAEGRVQTRDGQYVLKLAPGETTLFAQIDTDTSLTDVDFKFVFSETLGVLPE